MKTRSYALRMDIPNVDIVPTLFILDPIHRMPLLNTRSPTLWGRQVERVGKAARVAWKLPVFELAAIVN